MVPKDRSDYIFRMFRLLFLDMSDGKYATTIIEKKWILNDARLDSTSTPMGYP